MGSYSRISKKKCKIARSRAHKLLNDVRIEVSDRYVFSVRLVGSGSWGTMIEDENGHYDLDYQISLTKRSPVRKNDESFKDPTQIKRDFKAAFDKNANGSEVFEDSTSAITLKNADGEKPYSIDFVIIDGTCEPQRIIKRNMKKGSNITENTWCQMPSYPDEYNYFKTLSPKDKQNIVEKVISLKRLEKKNKDPNRERRSSSEILIQEIINYAKHKR